MDTKQPISGLTHKNQIDNVSESLEGGQTSFDENNAVPMKSLPKIL